MPPADPPSAWQARLHQLVEKINREPEPDERIRRLGALIDQLGFELERITWDRDDALTALLKDDARSHRQLARDLRMARQRVDQLAAISRAGGRRPDPDTQPDSTTTTKRSKPSAQRQPPT